jgi:hypothetical protein
LKKKNQKTFPGCFAREVTSAGGAWRIASALLVLAVAQAPMGKSLLVLFFRKELLS